MLVVDTRVAIRACAGPAGFELLRHPELGAPPLLWSEFRSSVHEATWRGHVTREQADELRTPLAQAPFEPREDPRIDEETWLVADDLGWAKTTTPSSSRWRGCSARASSPWTDAFGGARPGSGSS
jgi:hypothetical protein